MQKQILWTIFEICLVGLLCWLFVYLFHIRYCGVMYQCGCTWPWNGGVKPCNVFNTQGKPKCPWCSASTYVSWLISSMTVSVIMFISYLLYFYQTRCNSKRKSIHMVSKDGCMLVSSVELSGQNDDDAIEFNENKDDEPSHSDNDIFETEQLNDHNRCRCNGCKQKHAFGEWDTVLCSLFKRLLVPLFTFAVYDTLLGFIFWIVTSYPRFLWWTK